MLNSDTLIQEQQADTNLQAIRLEAQTEHSDYEYENGIRYRITRTSWIGKFSW